MEILKKSYCEKCNDIVDFNIVEQDFVEEYKGIAVRYSFPVGKCCHCGSNVAISRDYNYRRTEALISEYRILTNTITVEKIQEILDKYNVTKEGLADIAGFGKVTVKRYFDGFIPSKEYSDLLNSFLNDESEFYKYVEQNKYKLKNTAINKIVARKKELEDISINKLDQIVNYILYKIEEVTPLAVEKILMFANGVNLAVNDRPLFEQEIQAWVHGPVCPDVYFKYKSFGYKPINVGIKSDSGCLVSLISKDELAVIDVVLDTFGIYSPKILEEISHIQTTWINKRVGYKENEPCQEQIDIEELKKYYIENEINSRDNIMAYIQKSIDFIRQQRLSY